MINPLRAMNPVVARDAELLVGPVRRRTQVLPVAKFVLFAPSLGRGPKMIGSLKSLFRMRIVPVLLQDLLRLSPFQTWMGRPVLVCDSMNGILCFPLKKDDVVLVFVRVLFHRVRELITLVIVIHSIDRAKALFAESRSVSASENVFVGVHTLIVCSSGH